MIMILNTSLNKFSLNFPSTFTIAIELYCYVCQQSISCISRQSHNQVNPQLLMLFNTKILTNTNHQAFLKQLWAICIPIGEFSVWLAKCLGQILDCCQILCKSLKSVTIHHGQVDCCSQWTFYFAIQSHDVIQIHYLCYFILKFIIDVT